GREQKVVGRKQKLRPASCLCLLPFAWWLLVSAFAVCARRVRLWCVVNFACFHDVSLVIVLPVAVDVDFHYDLVRLSVMNIVRFECQTVLAAQHRVDRAEYVGQLAFESYRIKSSAAF